MAVRGLRVVSPVAPTPSVRMKSNPATAVLIPAVLAPVTVLSISGRAVQPMTKVG